MKRVAIGNQQISNTLNTSFQITSNMSWLSDNYEKVTLGAAVTALAALGYISVKNKSDQTNAFILPTPRQNQEVEAKGLAAIDKAKVSIYMEHKINQADLDGRKVDLFTGIILFSQRDDPKNPVDLLKSDPVHAGIPNTWWMENNLDPGYGNAAERDPDDDGFSNREEYEAETDPNNAGDYPEPVTKLGVRASKPVYTTQVHIKPRVATDGGRESFFNLENKVKVPLNKTDVQVKLNEVIKFKKPLMQNRFKFAGLDKRRNANGMVDVIWVIEDLQPNKKGTQYRFDKRGDLDGHPKRSLGIMDNRATLVLNALNQETKPFEVDENTYFSLPFDPKAEKKPYLLKTIDIIKMIIVVEYLDQDGNKIEHLMPYTK